MILLETVDFSGKHITVAFPIFQHFSNSDVEEMKVVIEKVGS